MDHSPMRSVFLASNDFCSTQKSKYGNLNNSRNESGATQILDNTLQNISNKSMLGTSNYNNVMAGDDKNFGKEKQLQETQVPVKVRSLEREEYMSVLNLSIKTVKRASPQQNQLLQITDDNNLHFLQVLNFTEQEFLILKSEQQLRIDFQNFPTKLMEFIDLTQNSSKDESICFGCNLDLTKNPDAVFQIVENNEFKSQTHLNLKFRSANDEMLKKYLSNGWKTTKADYENLFEKYTELSENYELKASQYEKLNEEIRNITEESHHSMEKLRNEYEKKINEIKESFLDKENSSMKFFESDKSNNDHRFKEREQMLLNKIERLEQNLNNTTETKLELESKDKESRQKIRILESEYNTTSTLNEKLRIENKDQEMLKFDHEKKITEFSARLEGLTDKLTDKNEMNNKNDGIIDRYLTTIKQNEQLIQDLRNAKNKLESKLKDSFQEINKASEQISKLQEEFNKKKSTLKTRNNIIKKQESIVNQKQDEINSLSNTITDGQRETNQKDTENKKLMIEIEDLKKKLEELQTKLSNSNEMISYLNTQLNETPKSAFGGSNTIGGTVYPKSSTYTPIIPKSTFGNNTMQNNLSTTNDYMKLGNDVAKSNFGNDMYSNKSGVGNGVSNNKPFANDFSAVGKFGGSATTTSIPGINSNQYSRGFGEPNVNLNLTPKKDFGNSDPYKAFRDKMKQDDVYNDFNNRNSSINNKFSDKNFHDLSAIKNDHILYNDNKADNNSQDDLHEEMNPRSYKHQGIQKIKFEFNE